MRPFFFIFTCFNGYSRYRHIKAEVYLNILHTLSAGLVGFVDDDLINQFVHDLRRERFDMLILVYDFRKAVTSEDFCSAVSTKAVSSATVAFSFACSSSYPADIIVKRSSDSCRGHYPHRAL